MCDFDFCVVGAGVSGLTACYELLKSGATVLLIERDDRTGGLAKSFTYDGHTFDIGPKRFHTDDPSVLDFLAGVSEGEMLRIPRSTEVHFLGRYFDWPLSPKALLRMPLGIAMRAGAEILRGSRLADAASFHQYIRSRYGETLYRTFFEPYTRKFLRWDVEDIHADWASTGINRTIIDKRVRAGTCLDLFKSVLLPTKVKTQFLYPAAGGFGGFFDRLLTLCKRRPGMELLLHDSVTALEGGCRGLTVTTAGGRCFSADNLVWTGNLNDLSRISGQRTRLPYLNTVFYNVICREEGVRRKGAQWIYVSEGNALVSRITCMRDFAAYTCPPGYYNFICEVTDSQQAPTCFEEPEKFVPAILRELVEMGFLERQAAVEAVYVNPVRDTYPIYFRGYLEQFSSLAGSVRRFSERIHLLGRSGGFWYNNADHSIRAALEMARKLTGQSAAEFDQRVYFGGKCARAATATT